MIIIVMIVNLKENLNSKNIINNHFYVNGG
jgi:hypothetical protein